MGVKKSSSWGAGWGTFPVWETSPPTSTKHHPECSLRQAKHWESSCKGIRFQIWMGRWKKGGVHLIFCLSLQNSALITSATSADYLVSSAWRKYFGSSCFFQSVLIFWEPGCAELCLKLISMPFLVNSVKWGRKVSLWLWAGFTWSLCAPGSNFRINLNLRSSIW